MIDTLGKYRESDATFRCKICWRRVHIISRPPSIGAEIRRYSHLTPKKHVSCNGPLQFEKLVISR